uniref:Uncharacterized protein n=1 Tax=Cacopsylla melanoneura TaxID=428564 RepID=A0A8D8YIN3_9HEMI
MWWKKSMTWCWKIGEQKCAILLRVWGFQLKGFGTFYTNLGMKKLCARWVPRLIKNDKEKASKNLPLPWPNCTNYDGNCCPIHPSHQTLLPATTICSLTSKNGLEERNLPPILN